MKAILEFNLPEEEPEFMEAVNGGMFKHVLWQLDQNLRANLKYGELPPAEYKCYETIRKDLHSILSANNLTIEWKPKSKSWLPFTGCWTKSLK